MDRVGLFLPNWITFLPFLWRADHAVDANLSLEGRTEANADHLIHHSDDPIAYIGAFKVTTTSTAFTEDTLRDGVEGHEGDVFARLDDDLFERGERVRLSAVEVGLVYFISEEDKVVLLAKIDDLVLRLPVKKGTGRVTRIDDDESLWLGLAFLTCLLENRPDFADGGTPLVSFVEVIGNRYSGKLGESCSVQGVLWDGNKEPRLARFGYEH